MFVRQVQGHEVQGHHLRPLRRQGHALARPPQAHGPHQPGRADRAHLVLQGPAVAPRRDAGHEDQRHREDRLLPGLRRHRSRQDAAEEEAAPHGRRISRRVREVRRRIRSRDGRRRDQEAARHARSQHRAGAHPPRHREDQLQAEDQGPDQAPEDGRGHPQLGEQVRVDGHGRDPGDPAGPASAGAAGERQLRHERSERPLSPHHQPQQPPEEARRPQRAGSHHSQREANAAAGGRCAVRQRPLPPPGAGHQSTVR